MSGGVGGGGRNPPADPIRKMEATESKIQELKRGDEDDREAISYFRGYKNALLWVMEEFPNVPDQRPGAADLRLPTRALSPGSLHLVCWPWLDAP